MVAVFCVFSTILNRDSQLVSSSLSSKWKQIIMTNSLVKTGTVNSQGAFLYIMIGPLPVDSLQFFDLINWILDTDWIKKKLKPAGFETPRLLLLFFGYPLFSFLNPKGYIFCATAIFQSVVWVKHLKIISFGNLWRRVLIDSPMPLNPALAPTKRYSYDLFSFSLWKGVNIETITFWKYALSWKVYLQMNLI